MNVALVPQHVMDIRMSKKDKDDTVLTIHFTEEGTLNKANGSNKMEHLGYQR